MIGAPQPLVLAKPAAIDTAQAARYFGARGEPDDRTMTLLETCAMPLLAAATPRAVWLEADTAALAEAETATVVFRSQEELYRKYKNIL